MEGSSRRRPPAAVVTASLADHYRLADGPSWMYGQGSVIAGLSDDSDLDLVLVWDKDVPGASTLPGSSDWTSHGPLVLEQAVFDGYDVDLMHVPRRTFENWLHQ